MRWQASLSTLYTVKQFSPGGVVAKKQISHNQLFALILDELFVQLGDALPSREIINAAERLAVLIDNDFNLTANPKVRLYSNYYSHELDWAFVYRVWQIACHERGADLLSDQRIAADERAMAVLRNYLESW